MNPWPLLFLHDATAVAPLSPWLHDLKTQTTRPGALGHKAALHQRVSRRPRGGGAGSLSGGCCRGRQHGREMFTRHPRSPALRTVGIGNACTAAPEGAAAGILARGAGGANGRGIRQKCRQPAAPSFAVGRCPRLNRSSEGGTHESSRAARAVQVALSLSDQLVNQCRHPAATACHDPIVMRSRLAEDVHARTAPFVLHDQATDTLSDTIPDLLCLVPSSRG
jgi:hypothetical protein